MDSKAERPHSARPKKVDGPPPPTGAGTATRRPPPLRTAEAKPVASESSARGEKYVSAPAGPPPSTLSTRSPAPMEVSDSPSSASPNSRARILAQQRELMLRRRQEGMKGDVVRSVEDPARPGTADAHFTPAIKQFSTPRTVPDDPYSTFGTNPNLFVTASSEEAVETRRRERERERKDRRREQEEDEDAAYRSKDGGSRRDRDLDRQDSRQGQTAGSGPSGSGRKVPPPSGAPPINRSLSSRHSSSFGDAYDRAEGTGRRREVRGHEERGGGGRWDQEEEDGNRRRGVRPVMGRRDDREDEYDRRPRSLDKEVDFERGARLREKRNPQDSRDCNRERDRDRRRRSEDEDDEAYDKDRHPPRSARSPASESLRSGRQWDAEMEEQERSKRPQKPIREPQPNPRSVRGRREKAEEEDNEDPDSRSAQRVGREDDTSASSQRRGKGMDNEYNAESHVTSPKEARSLPKAEAKHEEEEEEEEDRQRQQSHEDKDALQAIADEHAGSEEDDGDAAAKPISPIESPSKRVDSPSLDFLNLTTHSNLSKFTARPCPKAAGVVQCYIKRRKSGTGNLYPEYYLYTTEQDRFLLAAKRRPSGTTSSYIITMSEVDFNNTSRDYMGKLRSNFVGTEFQIFDNGASSKEMDESPFKRSTAKLREDRGVVLYAANVLGSRGPRKMQVFLPRIDPADDSMISWNSDRGKDEELVEKVRRGDTATLQHLINKPPRWNEQVGAYVLNFNGRVTMASVKNFQLVDPGEHDMVILQFGRVGKDDFTMDLQWPISPLQAFAVTLSSFDSKIACD